MLYYRLKNEGIMSLSDVKNITGWGGLILLILAMFCKFVWNWSNWVFIFPIIPLIIWLAIVVFDVLSGGQ